MWLEAILSQDDLMKLVTELLPTTLRLGNDGDLHLHEVHEVHLVEGEGLRVVCRAKLHWPVLGIPIPVTLNSLDALLLPVVKKQASGDSLVFKLRIEHADLSGVPTSIDDRITTKVNEALEHAELTWRFSETLQHVFALPDTIEPATAIALRTAWGEVKITAETLVLAVSFHADVVRDAAADHAVA